MGQEADETAPALLKALAAAYGECLWEWSCIETELFQVFTAASGLALSWTLADFERQETLGRTFFAVKGIETRLAMTHALAQQRWAESPHLATWTAIHDELDKQRRVRGRIAHRTGLLYPNPDSSKPPLAVVIEPMLHVNMAQSYQDAKNRGTALVKLVEINKDFLRLRKRMSEFVVTLAQERHGAFAQPQVDQPLPLRSQCVQTPKESA